MARRKRRPSVASQPMQPPQDSSVLAAAEQKVESQLAPDVKESYMKIVVAGMHAGLENGPNSILASLSKSKDPIADCAKGAVALVIILKHQAKGIMPVKAMVPAAMTLMLKALAFADRTGIVKVGSNELVKATHIFMDTFLHKLGITPEMMQHAVTRAHAITQNPVAMEHMKRSNGFSVHPDAGQPPEGNA